MEEDQNKKRREAYTIAPPTTQELYGDLNLGNTLTKILNKLHLNEEYKTRLIHVIGDAILGFYPPSAIASELVAKVGITQEIADTIVTELSIFIEKIGRISSPTISQENSMSKSTTTPVTWTQDPVTKTPTAVPKITPQPASAEPAFGAKPLTREEVLKALVPKRTMASDTASLTQQPPNTP